MRTRSKALYEYLSKAGVLGGTPEEIRMAKLCYRRLYKKQWKQNKGPGNEMRIAFTPIQFGDIKHKARECGVTPTAYCRNAILAAAESGQLLPNRDWLLKASQLVGMAAIGLGRNTLDAAQALKLLEQADSELMKLVRT